MQGTLRTIEDTKMDLSSVTKDNEPKSFGAKAKRQQSKSIDSDNRSESPNSTHNDDDGKYTCKICGKSLPTDSARERHTAAHYERPFRCKSCELSFSTAAQMHRHARLHSGADGSLNSHYDSDESVSSSSSAGLPSANQRFTRKRRLEFNNNDKSGDEVEEKRKKTINNNFINGHRLACPACDRCDFQDLDSLEAHAETEHPELEVRCNVCGVAFSNYRVLNLHRFAAHPEAGRKAGKQSVTGFNDLTFIDFSSQKFAQIARTVCEQSFHKSVTEQRFQCEKCARDFPCESALDIHRQACFAGLPPQVKAKQRRVSDSTDEEMKREDFFANLDLQNRSPAAKMPYIKVKKDITLVAKDHAMRPSIDNTKDLADIQSILSVTSTGGLLEQLTQKTHEANHVTPPDLIMKDNEREEETQDAFAAEFRKMKLRGEFPCRLCTAIFPNLRALKGHNRVHLSGNGPGPYRCNMCPHSSLDKAALVRHMRTHNGDRPYECAVCNYAFTTKANCERHLRNRHNKITREDVKRSIIYHPSEDPNNDEVNSKLNISRDEIKRSFVFHTPESMEKDVERERTTNDRATPVSHFPREQSLAFAKERLNIPIPRDLSIVIPQPRELLRTHIMPESSPKLENVAPPRIKVRGFGQLTQIPEFHEPEAHKETDKESDADDDKTSSYNNDVPIVLSTAEGDVLDLSKKKPTVDSDVKPTGIDSDCYTPKLIDFNMTMLEKSQQLFMAQQQLLNGVHLPKLDPTASFYASQLSHLYRTGAFPGIPIPPPFPLNPYFLHSNPFLTPTASPQDIAEMKDRIQKEIIRGLQMSGGGLVNMDHTNIINNMALANERLQAFQQQTVPTPELKPQTPPPAVKHEDDLPVHVTSESPIANYPTPTTIPSPKPLKPQPVVSHSSQNSVKMVIKNGVLMPKQKQRRYRTERPFSCEHCSARFTLRSNMERHIKQQHPQYWSQRQRANIGNLPRKSPMTLMLQNITVPNVKCDGRTHYMKNVTPNENALSMNAETNSKPYSPISDQVKYAILAQQLKSQHVTNPYSQGIAESTKPQPKTEDEDVEDDTLVIDEDSGDEKKPIVNSIEQDEPNLLAKKVANEILLGVSAKSNHSNDINRDFDLKIAGNLISKNPNHHAVTPIIPTLVSQLSCEPKPDRHAELLDLSKAKEDANSDLVPVSRLVENSVNQLPFGQYFKSATPDGAKMDVAQSHTEGSEEDEEGLVASGSTSEGNNSGSDENRSESETANQQPQKKKSAYSLAPNRVSCPYCHRKFPWSSSLRRHVLTHTGQKPYKCPHCPLLFTTKSNCDRHLLRKHGGQGGAVGPAPAEAAPPPRTQQPAAAEPPGFAVRNVPERPHKCSACPSSTFSTLNNLKKHMSSKHCPNSPGELDDGCRHNEDECHKEDVFSDHSSEDAPCEKAHKSEPVPPQLNSDLPYKCHLCDTSYGERHECLDHIRDQHSSEYDLLVSKGALEMNAIDDPVGGIKSEGADDHAGEENIEQLRGKFPDYANRKVVCAFCLRRFWSAEDLRRHMRTHSGERPFACDVCRRRFTLKHSMLRHRKKHSGSAKSTTSGEEMSTASGDEDHNCQEAPGAAAAEGHDPARPHSITLNGYQFSLSNKNLSVSPEMPRNVNNNNSPPTVMTRGAEGKLRNYSTDENDCDTENGGDLIGNLLGISDKGMINKLLSSADEAAKLLGVNK